MNKLIKVIETETAIYRLCGNSPLPVLTSRLVTSS
jgi:homoserine trans-succinylase